MMSSRTFLSTLYILISNIFYVPSNFMVEGSLKCKMSQHSDVLARNLERERERERKKFPSKNNENCGVEAAVLTALR